MAALEPDVEFFGIRIPPNATVSFGDKDKRDDSSSSSGDDDDGIGDDGVGPLIDGVALVHATQVALGPNPAPGRHTVMAVKSLGASGKGRAFPIGTLEVGKTEQFSIDLMWSMVGDGAGGAVGFDGGDVSFMHTGKSDVYITGYKTVTSMLDDERGYSGGESDEDEFSSEEESDEDESEDDEEAPPGVPLLQRAAGAKGGGGDLSSSDDDDDGEEESEDDDSDSEDEDEEDGEGGRAFLAPPRTPAGTKRPLGAEDESDGDDESDDESDDEDETDSDEDDDDQPAAPPASKKAKQAAGEGAAEAAYASALAAFLREHGPTKLGALGAAVRRPASLPKLTTFLAGRADFRVDGEQKVSLVHP